MEKINSINEEGGTQISRRGFLGLTVAGVAAAATGVVSMPQVAEAVGIRRNFSSLSEAVRYGQQNGLVLMHTRTNGDFFVTQDIFNLIQSKYDDKLDQRASGVYDLRGLSIKEDFITAKVDIERRERDRNGNKPSTPDTPDTPAPKPEPTPKPEPKPEPKPKPEPNPGPVDPDGGDF